MKRQELLKALRKVARSHNLQLDLVREGGAHSVYRCGPAQFTIPRHTEINENTARAILRHVRDALDDGQTR